MAFIRRPANAARKRGVVLWDDWIAPQDNADVPQETQANADAAPPARPDRQVVAHSRAPASLRTTGNNRATTAKAAYAAMAQNFATPGKKLRKVGQK